MILNEVDKIIYKKRIYKDNFNNITGLSKGKFITKETNYSTDFKNPQEQKLLPIISSNSSVISDNSSSFSSKAKGFNTLRFSYSNSNQFDYTNKSLELPQGTNIYIPRNNNKFYQKLSIEVNPNSKFKDLFYFNKKSLCADNFHNNLPGYSGHKASNILTFKGKIREHCLSVDE